MSGDSKSVLVQNFEFELSCDQRDLGGFRSALGKPLLQTLQAVVVHSDTIARVIEESLWTLDRALPGDWVVAKTLPCLE